MQKVALVNSTTNTLKKI